MRNRIRIEKLEDIQGKKSIQERDRFCFCQLYPNYQGCNCKEYEEKTKAEGREE